MSRISNNFSGSNELQEADFTLTHYIELLTLAKKNYIFANYLSVNITPSFILWRHDIDCSINRAFTLSTIESEHGVKATYFINPHSNFYNLAEFGQYKLIKQIIELGHDIGLHFDADFYEVKTKAKLDQFVAEEANYLERIFGIRPTAFSFHNPSAEILAFEDDYYGGLVNCYSRFFKSKVSYCSDSNGYWRFNRLYEVLDERKDARLQVLTHPEWWQDEPMAPRKRVFRSVYGRAVANMRSYDDELARNARLNYAGPINVLSVLKISQQERFEFFDYLWNQSEFRALFIELWRIHDEQVNQLSKILLINDWNVSIIDISEFFDSDFYILDTASLLNTLFRCFDEEAKDTERLVIFNASEYFQWKMLKSRLTFGYHLVESEYLEEGCVYLCKIINELATFGRQQSWSYDGLALLNNSELFTLIQENNFLRNDLKSNSLQSKYLSNKKWNEFKQKINLIMIE